jgi:hypothetical protein
MWNPITPGWAGTVVDPRRFHTKVLGKSRYIQKVSGVIRLFVHCDMLPTVQTGMLSSGLADILRPPLNFFQENIGRM